MTHICTEHQCAKQRKVCVMQECKWNRVHSSIFYSQNAVTQNIILKYWSCNIDIWWNVTENGSVNNDKGCCCHNLSAHVPSDIYQNSTVNEPTTDSNIFRSKCVHTNTNSLSLSLSFTHTHTHTHTHNYPHICTQQNDLRSSVLLYPLL